MTNEKIKITKKERYAQLLEIEEIQMNDELVAFIEHEIELLDKKAKSNNSEKTKQQNEMMNNVLAEIKELYSGGVEFTVSEYVRASELCTTNGYVSQKITPVLKKLVASNLLHNEMKSKKSLFSVIE